MPADFASNDWAIDVDGCGSENSSSDTMSENDAYKVEMTGRQVMKRYTEVK